MRTTIDIPDEAYRLAKSYAQARGLSLGKAVGELVQRSVTQPLKVKTRDGLPYFDVPEDASPISLDHALALEDEL